MPTHQRRGRRNDGLYQAHFHRWLQNKKQAAEAARRRLTIEELRERAEEARKHHCEHTHIHPEVLLLLIQTLDRLKLVKELVAKHQEMAEKGLDGNSMLWTNVLGPHKRE